MCPFRWDGKQTNFRVGGKWSAREVRQPDWATQLAPIGVNESSAVVLSWNLRSWVTSTTRLHEQDLQIQPNPALSSNFIIASAAGVREMDLGDDARCTSYCVRVGD